jgi:two-component system, chemotaxis family, CheB/CheR fusion protein
LIVERAGDEVLIRVRDSGIGITPEMIPRLFDMYSQGEPPIGTQLQGFGIGLALVRQLIELHGGSVSAHSDGVGKGSEFIIRLPIANERFSNLRAAVASIDGTKPPKRKILIVEDNADSGESMAVLLQSDGHQARVASDGAGALAIAAQFKPDAAIVDIGLPDLDGYEVAARLRRQLPNIVLVALSGSPPDQSRGRDAGFKYYFVKPLQRAQLDRFLAEIPD